MARPIDLENFYAKRFTPKRNFRVGRDPGAIRRLLSVERQSKVERGETTLNFRERRELS
jgi:hypothetical protein